MTKAGEELRKAFEDIAYAEEGLSPLPRSVEETDSFEEVFAAIAMAEGGEVSYAQNLHPLFGMRRGRN